MLFKNLYDRVLKIFANLCGLELLFSEANNDFDKLVSIKLSFGAIFVGVITNVCLNKNSIHRRQIKILIHNLAFADENGVIIETDAGIRRSTGDSHKNILDPRVILLNYGLNRF